MCKDVQIELQKTNKNVYILRLYLWIGLGNIMNAFWCWYYIYIYLKAVLSRNYLSKTVIGTRHFNWSSVHNKFFLGLYL